MIHKGRGSHLTLPFPRGRVAWDGGGISQHIPGHRAQHAPSHPWVSAQLGPGLTPERGGLAMAPGVGGFGQLVGRVWGVEETEEVTSDPGCANPGRPWHAFWDFHICKVA